MMTLQKLCAQHHMDKLKMKTVSLKKNVQVGEKLNILSVLHENKNSDTCVVNLAILYFAIFSGGSFYLLTQYKHFSHICHQFLQYFILYQL